MRLLCLTGLVKAPTRDQLGAEGLAALVVSAEQLLRAGWSPDTDFLAGCQDYELEALAQAGDRLAADRAAYHAAANQGLRQAAMAAAQRDGGAALQAVEDAEDLANQKARADRTLAQALGETVMSSRLVNAPTKIVEIDKVTGIPPLPAEAAL